VPEDEPNRAEWVKMALGRFEGPLVRYAAGITGNVDAARDVVQDTFLRLCAADRAAVDSRLAAWLYTVCRNRALDVMRKERRMVPLTETHERTWASPTPAPSALAERRDDETQVSRVIATLPPNQQEVIRLKFQDALSYKEISAVTGLSVSNVGYLIHTAIKSVRRQLETEIRPLEQA